MKRLIPLTLSALLVASFAAAQSLPPAPAPLMPKPVVTGKGLASQKALAVVPLVLLLVLGGSRGAASGSSSTSSQ
jgi:hypothetical protein